MREAVGGAWLYYIFVVMIMFIVSFLAIFLNYMSAYRANNHLITVLEQSEGIMPAGIEQQLNSTFNYSQHYKACYITQPNQKGFIIRVATFMAIKIPLVDINVEIPVKNETRTINCYGTPGTEGYSCPPGNVKTSLATSNTASIQECGDGTGW